MGDLQERIFTTKKGSITSVQAVYVPATTTDPAPATTFSHLDATRFSTVPSRRRHHPAVDPLGLNSRILEPLVVGEEHYAVAREVQQTFRSTKTFRHHCHPWYG